MREKKDIKDFVVNVDITVSKRMYITASTPEEAEKAARELLEKDSFYYAKTCESVVSYDVVNVENF